MEENYASVLKDCSKAIELNAHSSKAYFRSATALFALDRLAEALDCCDRCLLYDETNNPVKTLREKIFHLKKIRDEKQKQRDEQLRKGREEQVILAVAYRVGRIHSNRFS